MYARRVCKELRNKCRKTSKEINKTVSKKVGTNQAKKYAREVA